MVAGRSVMPARVYALALRAYPRAVRDRFGAGMRDAFAQEHLLK